MLDSTAAQPFSPDHVPVPANEEQRADAAEPVIADPVQAAPYVNSVDATIGQPLVDRVAARKHELETALGELPAEALRARSDLELALSTIGELLTGDLTNVPPIVASHMNQWLERNKHLAERAAAVVPEPVVDAITASLAALETDHETTS
jgi:hypothetical protein